MRLRILFLALALAACSSIAAALPASSPPVRPASDDLPWLLAENRRLSALATYKDDEAMLRAKLANLAAINQSRRQAGLPAVKLDLLASRVANAHCADMVARNFMGHWGSDGRKPYQRYALAGGRDHVNENLYSSWRNFGLYVNTPANLERLMLAGHQAFMAERPPHTGHRQNILRAYHTHVGLGLALKGLQFRYAQEFIDRYVDLDTLPARIKPGETVVFQGKVLDDHYGPLALIIYYDRPPKPMADPNRQPNWYGDYGEKTFATVPPWDIAYDFHGGTFRATVSFKRARPGDYYCMLYVRADPDTIPYQGGMWYTQGAVPATGVEILVTWPPSAFAGRIMNA